MTNLTVLGTATMQFESLPLKSKITVIDFNIIHPETQERQVLVGETHFRAMDEALYMNDMIFDNQDGFKIKTAIESMQQSSDPNLQYLAPFLQRAYEAHLTIRVE